MKIKVQPAEQKQIYIPARAEGRSADGWELLYDEGKVFLKSSKPHITDKGWAIDLQHMEALIVDLQQFYDEVKNLDD